MPPQQRNRTPSDSDDESVRQGNTGMRRVVSSAEISVSSGGRDASASDYKIRKSSLIGYVIVRTSCIASLTRVLVYGLSATSFRLCSVRLLDCFQEERYRYYNV